MITTLVPPNAINTVWLKILPYVRDLVSKSDGRTSEMSLYEDFCKGDQMLWIAVDDEMVIHGFMSSRINEYPGRKMASIDFCAGKDSEEWAVPLIELVEKWAREYQCDGLEIIRARRGWAKKFGLNGFTERFVWGDKDLRKES